MHYTENAQTILIVDDNPNNLEVLSATLTIAGFQVSVAISGEDAIEQIKYHQPELILLDVMMPDTDGFETCRQLKTDPLTRDIPIIFMTALSDAEDKVKGLSLGAVDYVTKPFQQEEVLARIRVHLNICNLAKTLESQNKLLQYEIEQRERAEAALRDLNHELEQRVEERAQELSNTLQELQQAHVQLVHSDRMSSLGQLVAGIAHEINNPVNFIYGNIIPATEYIQDLLNLVDVYEKNTPYAIPELQRHLSEIDFNFLRSDLPRLLNSMKIGADRIRQIVLSLKNFSRLDEAEMKAVDIHEGIDNTLLILQNRIKARADRTSIQIVKDYGNLPELECYAGQLNQVFMNLLSNAIDALEERDQDQSSNINRPEPNTIRISTNLLNCNWVQIRIADNGTGIPDEMHDKIFEPFFTTKTRGMGTGLGLSISRQIIEDKHMGRIRCCSRIGQGTEFIIELPNRKELTLDTVQPLSISLSART